MRTFLVVVAVAMGLLVFQAPTAFASSLSSKSTYSAFGFDLIESNESRLVVRFSPKIVAYDTVKVDGRLLVRPNILGAEYIELASGAAAYVVEVPIAVPNRNLFAIQSISAQSVSQLDYDLAGNTYEIEQYAANKSAGDALLRASDWADVEYIGIARDQHLASVRFVAARYNAAANVTEIPTTLEVEIRFLSSNSTHSGHANSSSRAFSSAINAKAAQAWRLAQTVRPQALQKSSGDQISSDANSYLRVGVDSEGIYSISAQSLADAGISVSVSDVPTIKLYGFGGKELPELVSTASQDKLIEQPIIVNTNGSGELESIVFYGAAASGFEYQDGDFEHFINHYSERNFYILGVGGTPGLRAEAVSPPGGAVEHEPTFYTHRTFEEQELNSPYTPGSGRRWLGRTVDQNIPATFFPRLDNLLNQGGVLFRYSLGHKSSTAGKFDIRFGGRDIGTMSLANIITSSYEVARVEVEESIVPASEVVSAGELQFDYSNNTQNQSAFGYIDWYEVHYPRPFRAIDNALEFFSDPQEEGVTRYSISGFSGNVIGFDVSDRSQPILLQNQSNTGSVMAFNAMSNALNPSRYFVSGERLGVASLDRIEWTDLRNTNLDAEYVIVTHSDLLESAQEFKAYREAQSSFSAAVVTVDQLYNEFAAGMPDPTAIRDFLAFAMESWSTKPRYVLFWGDGHFDYRGLTTTQQMFVPTYQSLDIDDVLHAVNTTYLTEDYFVMVVGEDELVDIPLGRIPVVSNSQGSAYTEKLRMYERDAAISNWRTSITLIADDSQAEANRPGDRTLHTRQSEKLSSLIPASMKLRKLYLPDYPTENIPGGRRKPKVTQDLVSAVNSGTLLLNWIGHGNPRVWAHEQIFEKDETIPLFQNVDKPFFLTAATCDFGRFDDPARQSGAEDLLFDEDGGAIGIFSSARTVYATQNAQINEEFYGLLFDASSGSHLSVGEVLFGVKQEKNRTNDRKFYLLGDPAMRILIPPAQVSISSINGEELGPDVLPRLQALSTVELEGFVSIPGTNKVDETFNGTVVINLHDSDIDKLVTDTDAEKTKHEFRLVGGILNVSGAEVINGRFSSSIVVPKDISFSDDNGRLFAYAFNESETRFAKGSTQQFTIGGITTDIRDDADGPEIDIYLDNRTFVSGDYVEPIPLLIVDLADDTGINATGLGIGHDIQAWINDDPQTINLTDAYTVSLSNFRTGTAEQELFDLPCGEHRVRVRAWDVFNNFSETETFFRIPCEDGVQLDNVGAFPNPFQQETKFVFRHSAAEVAEASVQIFTTDGMRVRQISRNSQSRTDELLWDGRDNGGNLMPTGAYFYHLQVQDADGSSSDFTGQVLIVR